MVNIIAKLHAVEQTYRSLIPAHQTTRLDPVQLVQQYLTDSNIEQAAGEIYALEFFCKHLSDTQSLRPDVFEELAKRMLLCVQPDNYYGLRMEARIASSLARKRLNFNLQERPDFNIGNGEFFIECGSVWPNSLKNGKDYRERVASTIKSKNKNRYATKNTILAIEITSVVGAMISQGKLDDDTDFHGFLCSLANEMNFGSILLFCTVFSGENNSINSVLDRIDSPQIDQCLLLAMDRYFKKDGVRINQPFVPGQSTKMRTG